MKLILHYPTKPYFAGQKFGECMLSICAKYKEMGLLGHNGIDSGAFHGQPIYASHDGIVTFAGEDGSGGLGAVIRTHEAMEYKDKTAFYKTIYWHLKTGSIRLKASQEVKVGEIVGLADNTGFSTGDHLHYGLKPQYQGEQNWEWWNAESDNGYKGAIDPMPFFSGKFAVDMFRHAFSKDLQFGTEGDDVRALQTILQGLGFFPIEQETTQFYGRITEQAVKEYQKQNNIISWGNPVLTGFGRAGPKTRASLNSKYSIGM